MFTQFLNNGPKPITKAAPPVALPPGVTPPTENPPTEDPKKKKEDPKKPPVKKEYDWDAEMRKLGKKNLKFDNIPATQAVKNAAAKMGLPANLLYSSAYIEGMNKAIADPDGVSEAYVNAGVTEEYPVDGFYNYGVDRFGERYDELKQYLPEGFDKRFKVYDAFNEKKEKIKTAAFRTNEDALMAKGAFIKAERARVEKLAKSKNVVLDDEVLNYLTMAAYNGGFGNAEIMLNEYAAAKDKAGFVKKGLTTRKGVHKNIISRMTTLKTADELLAD